MEASEKNDEQIQEKPDDAGSPAIRNQSPSSFSKKHSMKGVRQAKRLLTKTMLSALRSLDYTIILCQDIKRMRHFYHEILGFSFYSDWPDWVDFQLGASRLALRLRGRTYDGPAPSSDCVTVQLAFRVTHDQVESCSVELQKKGVSIIEPPTDQAWGHRTLFFKDPEGNLLEIYAEL